jgi:hypothetical protein
MAIAGLLGVFLQDKARDPNERTRKTDLPAIDLVGRSESIDAPRDSDTRPVVPDRITLEYMERLRKPQVQSNGTSQPNEQGSGWNG